MSAPRRVQLSRKKGWRMPAETRVVSRPTLFGNPFWKGCGCRLSAVHSYRTHLEMEILAFRLGGELDPYFARIVGQLPTLRGKNLACWCPEDLPAGHCHADVLLELANAPEPA